MNFEREKSIQQFYLHDKFLVFGVDEVEDVQVDSGAKVICRLLSYTQYLEWENWQKLDLRESTQN